MREQIDTAKRLLGEHPTAGFHGLMRSHLLYWAEDASGTVEVYPVLFSDLKNFNESLRKQLAKLPSNDSI